MGGNEGLSGSLPGKCFSWMRELGWWKCGGALRMHGCGRTQRKGCHDQHKASGIQQRSQPIQHRTLFSPMGWFWAG